MSLCECGCGQETNLAPKTSRRNGWVAGEPMRFVLGHAARKHPHGYTVKDMGYATPCWIWNGDLNTGGYPRGPGHRLEHRAALIASGVAIPSGHDAHHLCEQKTCVRPDHMQVQTKRGHRLAHLGPPKITPEQAQELRESSEPIAAAARRYGISRRYARMIRRGERLA